MEIVLCIIVVVIIWLFIWPNDVNTEPFPYPDECWDCNRGNCNGCSIRGGDIDG